MLASYLEKINDHTGFYNIINDHGGKLPQQQKGPQQFLNYRQFVQYKGIILKYLETKTLEARTTLTPFSLMNCLVVIMNLSENEGTYSEQ